MHAARIFSIFGTVSRKEEQLLQTVLNNMSQGVLMFDSETCLVFCNRRYIELYAIVRPHCSLRIFFGTELSAAASPAIPTNIPRGSPTASPRAKPSATS